MEEPEVNKTVEQPASEKLAEVVETVAQHANKFYNLTREEMIEKLRELLNTKPITDAKEQVESLKQNFYRKLKAEMEAKLSEPADSEAQPENAPA